MKKLSMTRLVTNATSVLRMLNYKSVVFCIIRIIMFNTAQNTKGIFEGFLKPRMSRYLRSSVFNTGNEGVIFKQNFHRVQR